MLATLAELKARLGITGSGDDAALTLLLRAVSARLAIECGRVHGGRPCLEKTDLVWTALKVHPGQGHLWLPAWPIVSVEEVVEAVLGAFDEADELAADEDYQVDAERGALLRIACDWLWGDRTVRVTYVGGYTAGLEFWAASTAYDEGDQIQHEGLVYEATEELSDTMTATPADPDKDTALEVNHADRFEAGDHIQADGSDEIMLVSVVGSDTITVYRGHGGTTPENLAAGQTLYRLLTASPADDSAEGGGWEVQAGEVVLPDDLWDAAIQQASEWWQRRHSVGLVGEGAEGGNVSWANREALLPQVRAACGPYRRMM